MPDEFSWKPARNCITLSSSVRDDGLDLLVEAIDVDWHLQGVKGVLHYRIRICGANKVSRLDGLSLAVRLCSQAS